MNIISFIKSLLPRLQKDQVLEDLRVTVDELGNVSIPNYTHASDFFRSNKLQSDANKQLSDLFYRKFEGKGGRQNNVVSEVAKRLPFLKDNAEFVIQQIELLLEKDIISEGLTAKKAFLIRTANHLSFLSSFAPDLLNVIYVNEALAINAKNEDGAKGTGVEIEESMRLAPAVVKHVDSNIMAFGSLIGEYGIPTKDFEKLLETIPEVIISSRNAGTIAGLFNEKDIDPLLSGYVQKAFCPVYSVRLIFAEWQAARYKAKRETKRMLELRLLHLKLLQEKKNDPKIEEEINYIQGRVDKIQRYLREVEESVEEVK